jgi:ATP-dependent Zn protease
MIDSEISQIISTQHQTALEILNKQKEILIKGASLLLKNEKIQGDELKALIQERRPDQAEAQGDGPATGAASNAA